MGTEERFNNSSNNNSYSSSGLLNGGSSSASGSSELRTYKRRRKFNLEEHSCKPSAQFNDKVVKELVDIDLQKNTCEQVCDPKINCHSLLNGSDDCSYQPWRNMLENMCRSLSPEGGTGGIQGCIRDALNNTCTNTDLAEHHDGQSHFQSTGLLNGSSITTKGLSAVASNGSSSESGHAAVSRICERVFFKLIMSGKFALLCKLLSENFDGLKMEKVLNFSLINTRIKEGAYEHTPMLFSSDLQQIWRRLHSIGNQMVSLANNLSQLSRAFCNELGGVAEVETSSDRKHESPAQDSDMLTKWEEPGASVFCTCRQCGEKSDGRDCLVCDSCEEMFHVSCIHPAVKEIPHKSWYCANCTASGIESLHEDCVVCERLNANSGMNGGADITQAEEEALHEFEESADGVTEGGPQLFKGSKQLPCEICGHMLRNGEEIRVCEHTYCPKYYHTRCLTKKQLKSYGPRWYCPSCLCRVCLTDKDDEKIVMCDGCDHGYHIYCMKPPRTSVPEGNWFCSKCDAGIQAICKVRKLYEGLERDKRSEGKRITESSLKKSISNFKQAEVGSGGMDMLLTAARTLNEEDLAALDA